MTAAEMRRNEAKIIENWTPLPSVTVLPYHSSPTCAPSTFYFICLPETKVSMTDVPASASLSLAPLIKRLVFRMGEFDADHTNV